MVSPWMEFGNLRDYLKENCGIDRLSIVSDFSRDDLKSNVRLASNQGNPSHRGRGLST
jgi:hypothetical protein